ncbi:hypothetical protein CUP3940_0385 [Campylobacter upsaliensis RM3940]|uniref:hypothetical protein n=1 Tax=Campylobacter upsaliensis TaxID=28080 RepID=UPI0015934CEE|nr:hypothetical protein [Campylobacter upsaliensis]QKF87366.1 hypothetical protein CUP3940_0385 [Campylobacter upsaliensis RM3940]
MKNKLTRILDNLEKLAGSFSLTLIALISYLFLNAENLIFLKAKFGKLARFGRVVPFKGKIQSKTRQRREPLGRLGL